MCENCTIYYLSAGCYGTSSAFTVGASVSGCGNGPIVYPFPYPSGEDEFGGSYSCSSWAVVSTSNYQSCVEVPGDGTGGGGPAPVSGLIALQEIQSNKVALYGPCPGLTDNWKGIIGYKPPKVIADRLAQLSANPQFAINPLTNPSYVLNNNWWLQAITNAEGIAINLDNFSVFMDALPIVNGKRMTINEFTEHIRLNMNLHVDTKFSSFEPHPSTGVDEAAKWQSSNPLGAVIAIGIPIDQCSVIVSEYAPGYESSGWTFSTIHDPLNGDHPVSGTRVFGCYETAGGYVFYTQGADRLTNYGQALIGLVTKAAAGKELQFTQADQLWKSLQTKVAAFVNSHGAHATINPPITNRPKWSDVKQAIEQNRSLSTVPCN